LKRLAHLRPEGEKSSWPIVQPVESGLLLELLR